MGASMEVHAHLAGRDSDLSGHVDEVAEDLSGLRVGIAAHALREEPVEPAREDQQCHVEVDDRDGEPLVIPLRVVVSEVLANRTP